MIAEEIRAENEPDREDLIGFFHLLKKKAGPEGPAFYANRLRLSLS